MGIKIFQSSSDRSVSSRVNEFLESGVKAGIVSLNATGIHFELACALVAKQFGLSFEEAKQRIEYWEELSGLRLERSN